MNDSIDFLQKETLMLIQATLGAISPNFRLVSIKEVDKLLMITIILERQSDPDLEEIDDIACEFEALHENPIEYEIETIITDSEITWPSYDTIVIYRRKEF